MHILSLVPEARFIQAGVAVPEALKLHFVSSLDSLTLSASPTIFNSSPNSTTPSSPSIDKVVAMLVPPAGLQLSTAQLQCFPMLQLVQTSGAGYDSVDLAAANALGVAVANSPGMNAVAVAEYVFATIVNLQRSLALADREIRAHRYTEVRELLLNRGCLELAGSTVGFIGLGNTAQALVPLLRALDCTILAHDIHWPEEFAAHWHIQSLDIKTIFAESDVVSLHCPLLDSTRHLVNYDLLSLMRPKAVLINTARGGIINEVDLARALKAGLLHGAALDVFENEYLAPDSPLLHPQIAERLILSPHLAGVTRSSFKRMLTQALDNLVRVLQGHPPKHVVSLTP